MKSSASSTDRQRWIVKSMDIRRQQSPGRERVDQSILNRVSRTVSEMTRRKARNRMFIRKMTCFFSLSLLSEVVFFLSYFRKFEVNEGNQRVEEDTERFFSSQLFTGFQVLTNGSLRIHHLQIQDTGYYLCWAENLVRRTYAQIRLEVQGSSSSIAFEHPFPSV